ncbi:MAG: cysteine synthase family protein [Rickettsiales bacterium]|jgi:cysteine synthase|nr:cysteine synthase family protein [Rickettsiales bacterium]
MKYNNSFFELVGNTPLIKLNNMGYPKDVNVFAKMELLNPGGSIKDRVGINILKVAEEQGILKEGGTIIEATAGNTGIGLAFAGIQRGYKVIFVVPTKFSQEKQDIMKILGAEIINTPKELGMLGAVEKVKEILNEYPDYFWAKQFENEANPQTHFLTTAPEIYDALDGQIDYFVAGAGSGGTFTGVLKYLKSKNKKIKGILADPRGSVIGGNSDGSCSIIEGIGNDFIPKTMDVSLIDKVEKIVDEDALMEIQLLAKREGILAGGSSGSALAAVRKNINSGIKGNIVVILPDRGDRYLSKGIFNNN